MRKLKFIEPRKGKEHKIWNDGEQAAVMGPLHALLTPPLLPSKDTSVKLSVTDCSRAEN